MVKVTKDDRDIARELAFQLAVPDIQGSRQHDIMAEIVAAHRLATIEECAKVAKESKEKWMKHPNNRIVIENIESTILALKGKNDD